MLHSHSGGGGREISRLCVSVDEEVETRLGTSAMGEVSSDSQEDGSTVRGGAEAGRWGGEGLDALYVLLGGERNAAFRLDTSTGERGPSESESTFSRVTMTGRVRSWSLRRVKLKPNGFCLGYNGVGETRTVSGSDMLIGHASRAGYIRLSLIVRIRQQ